jgi:hypothetical protein
MATERRGSEKTDPFDRMNWMMSDLNFTRIPSSCPNANYVFMQV